VASSEYWHVRHAKFSRWLSGSSFGYNMLELSDVSILHCAVGGKNYHSLQKRKVICSIFLVSSTVLGSGVAMLGSAFEVFSF
jgi:hypothetical protein